MHSELFFEIFLESLFRFPQGLRGMSCPEACPGERTLLTRIDAGQFGHL